MKFEDKIKELEGIVEKLENGETALDESFDLYKKAMGLIKDCDKELNKVKENVNKIVTENNELKKFELEEENK